MHSGPSFAAGAALLGLALLPGCGDTPVDLVALAPPVESFPIGTVLSIVSGETEGPVPGARVVVAGRAYETDSAGQVRLEAPASRGALVDVVAAGFLDRQTLLRSPEPRLSLWPTTSPAGLDQQTTAELVYTWGAYCCPADALGGKPLERVRSAIGHFDLVLDAEYRDSPDLEAAVEEAASLASGASGARVVFTPAVASTGPHIRITTGPDPSHRPIVAFAEVELDPQGYITGGRVVFVEEAYLTDRRRWRSAGIIVAHELGHVLGLGHSTAPGLMSVVDGIGYQFAFFAANGDFSSAEKLALRLMYQRGAGTRYPDDDRSAAATTVRRVRTVCEL